MKTLAELGRINTSAETSVRAREFTALCIAIATRKKFGAKERALEQLPPRVASIFRNPLEVYRIKPEEAFYQRAAVAVGSNTSDTWGADLANYQTLANAFAESIRNYGAFDKMIAGGMRVVPMRVRVGAITVGAVGATVAQFHAKTISKLTVSATTLTEQKCSVIIAVTSELARFGDTMAQDLFQRELAVGLAVETDETFCQALQSGATSIVSSGTTAEAIRQDLRTAALSVTTGVRSKLWLIVTPGILKALALVHTTTGDVAFENLDITKGGDVAGITVVPSDGCPAGSMILVDSSQVVVANEGITLDESTEASIQMEDTTPDSPPTSSTAYVSLFQQNWVGLKAERWIGIAKVTTTGVVAITGVSYSGDSPGP